MGTPLLTGVELNDLGVSIGGQQIIKDVDLHAVPGRIHALLLVLIKKRYCLSNLSATDISTIH